MKKNPNELDHRFDNVPEEMSPGLNIRRRVLGIIKLFTLGYATREELQKFCDKYGIDISFTE